MKSDAFTRSRRVLRVVSALIALQLFPSAADLVSPPFRSGLPSSVQAASAPARGRDYYEARGDIVWEVPMAEKLIALTFDDGPDPEETPPILDLLNQYQAKATFFVLGRKVDQYPELAAREVLEGHEIANHTYTHRYFNRPITQELLSSEIKRTDEAVLRATGRKPVLFRPPGGYYGQAVVDGAKRAGCKTVLWSWHQDTEDWNRPGTEKIIRKVLTNARNGDIILFHDHVEGKSQTLAALQRILPELSKRGYRFVTVSELLTHKESKTVGH
ncbi:polysaccharide deacetylase family protein [Gorillibacterium sp. sgz500922]|uniref:polysaccharide deacetylase family protein n=1 Tax=Gorillibacterium sp. sgz500922 TaxID=3446694 RepID=UPI003F67BBC1